MASGSDKFSDLRRRIVFLILAILVYRLGAHIPVPGIDPDQLSSLFKSQEGGILGLFNMFSGGALSRFTIFALGIMPYISASIIMQLMTAVSPTLEALKKKRRESLAGEKFLSTRGLEPLAWHSYRQWASPLLWSRSPVW